MLPNGTVKTTAEHRLDDLNDFCLPLIADLRQPLHILDVAVSSGVSTSEWGDTLEKAGIRFSITGTDLIINAFCVKCGPVEGILDKERNFIHLGVGGRGLPPVASGPLGLVTRMLKKYLQLSMRLGARCEPMRLVTKRASVHKINMCEEDLLITDSPNLERNSFDVIRAANILNLSYFGETTIAQMIATLKSRLLDGGLLIVCRTDHVGRNNGTVFRLSKGSFKALARIGSGSEVESAILAQVNGSSRDFSTASGKSESDTIHGPR